MFFSGTIFYFYYVNATYETWRTKSNEKYPDAVKVREEILMMLKGLVAASFCPALSLYLSNIGYSKAYCGVSDYGWSWLVIQFFIFLFASDFFEFYYHRLGHSITSLWEVHKHHHTFYNPTPFSVIADEYLDQIVRASPLVIFPLLVPTNMDLLFFQYAVFFYAYGVYLHWGHEFVDIPLLHPHNYHVNTAFQHYLHHAVSSKNKPYHTGFFFKFWDRLFGSLYDGPCVCVACQIEKGERSQEKFKRVVIPDYSPLLSVNFWLDPKKAK